MKFKYSTVMSTKYIFNDALIVLTMGNNEAGTGEFRCTLIHIHFQN